MAKIRKAVFPVAGLGTRFLPATKAMPKELLPIIDKPIIQYAVEEAVAAGITDLIFVTGRTKRAIEDHFDANPELERALRDKGIDLEHFTQDDTERGKCLLYVGARGNHKNFGLALDLAAGTVASRMRLSLDVLGGGAPTTAERERIAHLGIANRVRFLGPQDLDGVRAAYRRAFALVYPSFSEGFGIPPLEAMACGCPVLCSDRSSLPEVVGDAAVLFDPSRLDAAEDALRKVYEVHTRKRLIESGFARAA